MELSIPVKKSNLQIQKSKVKSLQYLTAKKVYYYIVNLVVFIIVLAKNSKVVALQLVKKITVISVNLKLDIIG